MDKKADNSTQKPPSTKQMVIFLTIIGIILCAISPKWFGRIYGVGTIIYVLSLFGNKESKFHSYGKAKKSGIIIAYAFLALMFFSAGSSVSQTEKPVATNKAETQQSTERTTVKAEEKKNEVKSEGSTNATTATVTGELKVHFIDVGQADSILVQQGNQAMLIDAGNNADDKTVKGYLDSVDVKNLDYVIGTHPHEDHIGGMDYIINSFNIGKTYLPQNAKTTTKTYADALQAISNKGMKATNPTPGESFKLGDAICTIVAPNESSYKDLNDYSIVVKVQFGKTSFLLTGDAQATSEMQMVNKGYDLKADVLKVGHHGSKSSTCANFLSAVSPKYAVISVGKGNDYGHPFQGTLDRLKNAGVALYRTDECGTIVATSNGTDIKFDKNPGSYAGNGDSKNSSGNSQSGTSAAGKSTGSSSASATGSSGKGDVTTYEPAKGDRTVYWTNGGKSYHYNRNCRSLAKSKNVLEGPASSCPKTDPCNNCVR